MRKILFYLVISIAFINPAFAQTWSGQITPYGWATGIKGDLRATSGGNVFSFDNSFSKVWKDLKGAFFISAYARKGHFVVSGDYNWASVAKNGHLSNSVDARAKLSQQSVTMLVGQRVIDQVGLSLDMLAGLRAWRIKSSIDLGNGAYAFTPKKDFIDPILAVRMNKSLAAAWSSIFYVDYGGFGMGSKQTTQATAALNYQVNERFWLSVGYRVLEVDYRYSGRRVNVTMEGPLLGGTWRF